MERLKHIKDSLMACVEGQMCNLANVDAQELGAAIDMIKDLEEAIYYCTITKAMTEQDDDMKMMMKYQMMNGNGQGNGHQKEQGNGNGNGEMYFAEMYQPYPYPMYANGNGGNSSSSGGSGGSGGGRGGNQSSGGGGSSQSGGGGRSGGNRSYMEDGREGGGGGGGNRQYYADGNNDYGNPRDNEKEGRSGRSRRQYMESKSKHSDTATQMRELEKYMQELSSDILEMIEEASPEERQFLGKKIATLATKVDALE